MKLLRNLTAILFIGLLMVSCAQTQLAYYDPQTHKDLSYLIPQVQDLYDSYTTENINTSLYNNIDLSLRKLISYEKSKKYNENTIAQLELLYKMIKRHYDERMIQETPWSLIHKTNKLRNTKTAMNLIVDTELLKNKRGN